MPVELLKCAKQMQPFFNELPMPKGLNGNEVNVNYYFTQFMGEASLLDISLATEVFRRMQDLHDSINSGRFFLCNSQRLSFPEIYSEPIPSWANEWVKSQYLDSAIQWYSASFDFFLQVTWLSFEIFKDSNIRVPHNFSQENLDKILCACNVNLIKDKKNILGDALYDEINKFLSNTNTQFIRNLCKQLKHRKRISYSEISSDKHPLWIKSEEYNSQETLLQYSLTEVIDELKTFHNSLRELCEFSLPYWKEKVSL